MNFVQSPFPDQPPSMSYELLHGRRIMVFGPKHPMMRVNQSPAMSQHEAFSRSQVFCVSPISDALDVVK